MPKSIDDETREILTSFVAEGYERLDDSEAQLSRIDTNDCMSQLNSIFRLFHSVKGSAGFLGFENVKKLTHEAETLLDVFLKENVPVTQDALDVIYATIDVLRKLISIVETEYEDTSGEDIAKSQTAKLTALIASLRATAAGVNEICLSELVSADMVHRFIGECSDLVDRAEGILLGINPSVVNADAINDVFRAIHTIKGNAGFFGYAYLERKCMNFETSLDKARNANAPVGESFLNGSMATIDQLRSAFRTVVVHDREAIRPADDKPAPAPGYKPLGEILVDMGAVRDDTIREALDEQERPLGEILVAKGVVDPDRVAEALQIQKAQSAQADSQQGREMVRREIRVDTAKLDKLFELVGELITAESMVINNPDLDGLQLDGFAKSFASLNKISREIQETTMMIRMIPLDGLFQKMTRLVRDLSRKTGKPIDFAVTGQDTEMDKNVIEQISDPLVHILRNAVDHGIEAPEARKAAGKPESGTITMDAKYEGSEIWIRVKDDGGGLNRDKILAKAIAKGLLKGDPAAIPDRDVWQCIFEPGFSTAEVVSDVSGRGVGLDVVKKNLERIRGRIDIKTQPGEGTEFTLAIPLTMAIIDGITVRVGSNRYSLSLNDIIEFFKITPEQLTTTDRIGDTVNIRKEFLPLIKIGEVFGVADSLRDPCEGIVIVVHNNEKKACLLIDEVIGNQQIVVKSLSEFLGKVDGISGCSILGDGGVSFIIDTGKLLSTQLA